MNIPLRMYTSEVLEKAKFSQSTLRKRQREGTFPLPVDRGREQIYLGQQVYEALGIAPKHSAPRTDHDRWAQALEAM